MPDNNYQEVIKNNKLFDGIPPQNLKLGFRSEQLIRKKEGEIIFQKGDESKNTYLVIAGRVKIKVYIENKSVKLNKTLNDFFGEIEVLEDTYRRSAAVANTDCILYSVSKSDLRTFLAEYPEINDNIIAYNKVEIPELQITIHPGLLKSDTDKLYVTPIPEDAEDFESTENTDTPVDEEFHEKKKEIDETARKISEINDEPEDDDDFYDASFSLDTAEDSKPIETAASPEAELTEKEKMTDVITEEEEVIPSGNHTPEDVIEDNPDAEEEETETRYEEEVPSEEELKADTMENQPESPLDTEPGEEPAEDIEETKEELQSSAASLEADRSDRENHTDDYSTTWINLSENETKEEMPEEILDEEQLRYEAENEKLKYDDTEIDGAKILNAIKRINSSLDKRTVYENIVREAVKLTEAQAGLLYRVDPVKNQLLTEKETENGFADVSYPISDGLTGLAAETGEIINVREPVKDFRFSEEIDSIRGIAGTSILCVPVKDDENNTIAVISLANSSSGKFSLSDEEKILQLVPHISQTLRFLGGIDGLLEKNKNDYLSTLTKFITDNIQTPVLTMKYYAAQIKKKSIPQDVRTVLNVLMDQADSVVDFLHSTLAFTENRNTLRIETCSLQEVMDDTLGLLAEYVESRNVGLYKKVESNINVKLDKKAFYQACQQIAKNACDAMGESGNIYITAKQSGDLVNIEFRDTGPGIPDDIKPLIFKPFKSFNKDNGTGLGLTIAQRIVRDHGGELTVESSPEQGATFIISLPVFDEI